MYIYILSIESPILNIDKSLGLPLLVQNRLLSMSNRILAKTNSLSNLRHVSITRSGINYELSRHILRSHKRVDTKSELLCTMAVTGLMIGTV